MYANINLYGKGSLKHPPCGEYPCEKNKGADLFDSFITHKNQLRDSEIAKNTGFLRIRTENRCSKFHRYTYTTASISSLLPRTISLIICLTTPEREFHNILLPLVIHNHICLCHISGPGFNVIVSGSIDDWL